MIKNTPKQKKSFAHKIRKFPEPSVNISDKTLTARSVCRN